THETRSPCPCPASPVSSPPGSSRARVGGAPPSAARIRAHLLRPGRGARSAAGGERAVPDLEPGAQRDPSAAAGLGHPPERRLLHHVPGGHPPGHRAGAARVLLAGLDADPPRARSVAATTGSATAGMTL